MPRGSKVQIPLPGAWDRWYQRALRPRGANAKGVERIKHASNASNYGDICNTYLKHMETILSCGLKFEWFQVSTRNRLPWGISHGVCSAVEETLPGHRWKISDSTVCHPLWISSAEGHDQHNSTEDVRKALVNRRDVHDSGALHYGLAFVRLPWQLRQVETNSGKHANAKPVVSFC